jgi:hypothetical protein
MLWNFGHSRYLYVEIIGTWNLECIYVSYYYEGEGENVKNIVKQPKLSNGHLFMLFEFRTHKGTQGIYGPI